MVNLFRLGGAEPPAANYHQNTGKFKQVTKNTWEKINADNWLRKVVYYIFEFIYREY